MKIRSAQIGPGEVKRSNLNSTESGEAVLKKIIAGDGIAISETGEDSGTGDVTISVNTSGDSNDLAVTTPDGEVGLPFKLSFSNGRLSGAELL